MAKFLFIYMDPVEKTVPALSPEEMQSHMQKWWTWLGDGQKNGWVTEMGDALEPEIKVVQPDGAILDGPHAESKEFIGGYSIVEAKDLETACSLAKGCPIFESGGSVQVRAVANLSPPA